MARNGTGNPTKTGNFPTDSLVSPTSQLQLPATFSNVENSSQAMFPDPAKAFVDMVISATSHLTPNPLQDSSSSSTKADPGLSSSRQTKSQAPATTIVEAPVVTKGLHTSSLVSSGLSPFAQVWVPTSNTIVHNLDILYPPGKNSEGREFQISDDAWVALELGEKSSQDFELPADVAPDLDKVTRLHDHKIVLPNGSCFIEKVLPQNATITQEDEIFPATYFMDLHYKVRSAGTYNFAGARVELPHSKLNFDLFRHYLADYDDIEICQFLQFGFPLGLSQEVFLEPSLKNHQSAYCYYTFIDSFLHKEVSKLGVAGPLSHPPFKPTMLSPMMTSPKNPSSRRPVFDASFGDWSLNENTPVKSYMGGDYNFKFPTVLDLADLIVQQGKGCLLWKRDLSRWFLQLPVDPADYDKLGFVWRGKFWWFVSFVWGCRHAGYAGQRVSSAILHILKKKGSALGCSELFNAVVYMDDFAGCESGTRATDAFEALGSLLVELGIQESVDKACSPSTTMKFLGVEFDTISMSMRVDEAKLQEITALSKTWARKTVATKQQLQSILGKLMWVSKVVRFSRCFVARIISILKGLRTQKQKVTLNEETRKDFLWWSEFLPVFNGVEMLVPDTVFCSVIGDATLHGGGSWNEREKEFFSRPFPLHLKDPKIYIHLKEFLVTIAATKLWGHLWAGKRIAVYCDNEAVVKTMVYQKPQDSDLQRCVREFLFLACKFHFQPIFLRISTGDNDIADFISRVHDPEAIAAKFKARGLTDMKQILAADEVFDFVADW